MTDLEGELLAPEVAPESGPRRIPWEDPAWPRLRGFFATFRDLLLYPEESFRDLGREDGAEALAFGLIVGVAGLLLCLYWYLLLTLGLSSQAGRIPGFSQIFGLGAGTLATLILLSPAVVLIDLLVSSLCLWAGAALVGCRPHFTAIWRIICYGQAGMAANLIPLLGGLVAVLWIPVLYYKGVQAVFQVTRGRALGALIICLALEGLVLLFSLGSLLALLGFLLLFS
jgi:hypothetical protein